MFQLSSDIDIWWSNQLLYFLSCTPAVFLLLSFTLLLDHLMSPDQYIIDYNKVCFCWNSTDTEIE